MSAATSSPVGDPSPRWLNTPRGRRDLVFIAAFLLPNILIPLLSTDLYPFSRAPMFSDAPRHCCNYLLRDPKGNTLDTLDFGLHRNYWGNPVGEGVGFHPPHSVDQFGVVAEREEVTEQLRQRLSRYPKLAYVDVTQEVLGDQDGEQVGVIPGKSRTWRVENPAYQGSQPR